MQKEQQTAPEMEEEQEYLTQTPSIQCSRDTWQRHAA